MFHGLQESLAQQLGVGIGSIAQLLEVGPSTRALELEVVGLEAILVDYGVEFVSNPLEVVLRGFPDGEQGAADVFEEVWGGEPPVHLLPVVLEVVLEDVHPKRLQFTDDIPRLVVGHVLIDELHDPFQYFVVGMERLYHPVDRLFLHLPVIQFHTQVGVEPQLPGEVSQHTLEKGVDGLHAEILVVVENQHQRGLRPGSNGLLIERGVVHDCP